MVSKVRKLVTDWKYDLISIGYPGPVLRNRPIAEPWNLGKGWIGFNFEAAFKHPVKVVNDAVMQAMGSYKHGKMLFLGLGTGLGSAMVLDDHLVESMELGHLPYKKATFEDYVGIRGLENYGKNRWRGYVVDVVERLISALEPDDVVLGGGNVHKLKKLPPGCRVGDNTNAFRGGFRLWEGDSRRFHAPHITPSRQGVNVDHSREGRSMLNQTVVKLVPSILSADFARLGEQVAEVERCGAARIHVDVMDGHFVPNISLGAVVVKALRKVTRLPLDVHLMITNPDLYLDEFCEAGADSLLVHWEGNPNLHRTVQLIKAHGKRAGVVINPATTAAVLEEILPDTDQVLVMTVNPGFAHQRLLRSTIAKIRRVYQMIEQLNPACDLEVDGGIDQETAPLVVAAGANVLVAGTAIFGNSQGVAAAMKRLQNAANNAVNQIKVR